MCTHKILTIVQPGFDYRHYPQDEQIILIRFFSLSLKSFQLQIVDDNPEIEVDYVVDNNGVRAIDQNQIWEFKSAFVKYETIAFASGKCLHRQYIYALFFC